MDKAALKDLIYYLAGARGFRPGIIEKDYYLTHVLNVVNEHLSNNIVFKGGTLLSKVYLDYHRLSEDLDFSYHGTADMSTRSRRSTAITPVREQMPSFLSMVGLTSDNPAGTGYNNSTQYVFTIFYESIITNREEGIKLEISLREPLILGPEQVSVNHFFQDPFTGEDLLPRGRILAMSKDESVAEKLKAAISRLTPAIRDFYDLGQFIRLDFDFSRSDFREMVEKKLEQDGYTRDYSYNLGLTDQAIQELKRTISSDLIPMLRTEDDFDLDHVLTYFNRLYAGEE